MKSKEFTNYGCKKVMEKRFMSLIKIVFFNQSVHCAKFKIIFVVIFLLSLNPGYKCK